ncbi:MAG: hypothetical protein Q7R78_02305, partial [bacterium]|nr:hypothetical protein [bacterium]
EMRAENLYDPIYFTYPTYQDSVKVVLLNEKQQSEWEKVREYLVENRYINNSKAREITNVTQLHEMSRLLKKWVTQGLLLKIESEGGSPKLIRYKLYNAEDFKPKV